MLGQQIKLVGSHYSPYSRKMRAYLRYKRISYEWLQMRFDKQSSVLKQPKVPIIPVIYFPEEKYTIGHVDSTPLIRVLEQKHVKRSVLPPSSTPLIQFLNDLLEDYADEWITKCMMHYRWSKEDDILKASNVLACSLNSSQSQQLVELTAKSFKKRQMTRLESVIGSNHLTAPFIENEYQNLLNCVDKILQSHDFLFGKNPSSSDFALYGQLSQLTGFDPTPSELAARSAPRVCAWVDHFEDLSGLCLEEDYNDDNNDDDNASKGDGRDAEWLAVTQLLESAPHRHLLTSIGNTYIPFLKANFAAHSVSDMNFSCELGPDLHPWTQNTFPYQAKCWAVLKSSYQALSVEDQNTLSSMGVDLS